MSKKRWYYGVVCYNRPVVKLKYAFDVSSDCFEQLSKILKEILGKVKNEYDLEELIEKLYLQIDEEWEERNPGAYCKILAKKKKKGSISSQIFFAEKNLIAEVEVFLVELSDSLRHEIAGLLCRIIMLEFIKTKKHS